MVKTTCACIIEKNGNIVLVKRKNNPFAGTWVLPGGHIDPGEDAKDACTREVKEETGLDVEPHFFDYNDELFQKYDWHAIVLIFYGVAKGDIIQNKKETTEINLFPIKKIPHLQMGFNHKEILFSFYHE